MLKRAPPVHALTAASLATHTPVIGAPKGRDNNQLHKADLNRARVAACEAREGGKAIGTFEYSGELLTLLVRLRKVTGDDRYLSDEEAESYSPETWRQFKAKVHRAMSALAEDLASEKITLKLMH